MDRAMADVGDEFVVCCVFFQAEDGIRDVAVTGVQTCALPILALHSDLVRRGGATSRSLGGVLGPILRDSLIFAIFWVLLAFYRRETYRERRQVALIGGLFALVLLEAAVVARFVPSHPEVIFLPFMAMLLTVLFNGRVSMIAAVILAIGIGLPPVVHGITAMVMFVIRGRQAAPAGSV